MRGWPKHVDRKYEYIPLTTPSLLLLNNNYTKALIFWFIHLRLLKAAALYCLHQLLFIICQACRGVAILIRWHKRSELYIESIRYIKYNFCFSNMTVNMYKTYLILFLCAEQVMNIQERNSTMDMPNGRKSYIHILTDGSMFIIRVNILQVLHRRVYV